MKPKKFNELRMDKSEPNRLQKAANKLRESLTIEKIRKIPKYSRLNTAQYLSLIANIEKIAVLLLESYVFTKNNTT